MSDNSIMCVNLSALPKPSGAVQKNIQLEKVLTGASCLSNSFLDSHYEDGWRELKFSTTLRSAYTNKVVCCNFGESHRIFYRTQGKVGYSIHKGYDLVMFLGSMSIKSMMKDDVDMEELSSIMFNGSAFNVMGLYHDGILDPIVYSICTVLDEPFERFIVPNLADDFSVCDIADISKHSGGNIAALLDEIVVVDRSVQNVGQIAKN